MGGLQKSTGRKIFVNIKAGELVTKNKEGIVDTFRSLEGVLTGINISTKEYEGREYEQLSLMITYDGELYELQMRFDSGYGRGFCYQISNATLDKPILFSPKYSEKDGKKDYWLFLNQFGKPLQRAFTKDNPNGLPPMKEYYIKGKKVWDNTDQLAFWKKMIDEKIRPNLLHPAIAENDIDKVKEEIPDANNITEAIDDLPF